MSALSINTLGLDVPTMQFLHNNTLITRPITDHPPLIQNTYWGAIATINILHPSSPFAPTAQINGVKSLPADGKIQMELMAEYIFQMFSKGVVMLALQEVPNPCSTDPAIAANFGFLRDKLKSLVGKSKLIDVDALTKHWLKTGTHRFGTSVLFNPNVFEINDVAKHDLNNRAARYVMNPIGNPNAIQVANIHGDFNKQQDTIDYITSFKGFCLGDLNITQTNIKSKDSDALLTLVQPSILIEGSMCLMNTCDGIQDTLSRTMDPNFTPDDKTISVSFKQRKNTIQHRFLEELNKLHRALQAAPGKTSAYLKMTKDLYSTLHTAQQEFFDQLTPQSTAKNISANLNSFRKLCESKATEANKIMGFSWMYRVVEVLVKAVVGLFAGLVMVAGTIVGKGLANEGHRKRYKDMFFSLEQTESTQAINDFKKAVLGESDQDSGLLDGEKLTQPCPTAVLFDLDGTLADTAKDFFEILKSQLQKNGIVRTPALSYEEIRAVAGLGADAMIRASYNIKNDDPKFYEYKQSFLDEYKKSAGQHAELFEGCLDILIELNKQGIPWAIVTDKPRSFTDMLIQKWGLPKHVSVCSDDEGIGEQFRKPNPKSLIVACQKMKVNPKDCVYIGDSLKDIQAGRAAPMQTIGVTYGYTPRDTLMSKECPADMYVESPQELRKTLFQLLNIEKKTLSTAHLMTHGMIFNGTPVAAEKAEKIGSSILTPP